VSEKGTGAQPPRVLMFRMTATSAKVLSWIV